MARGNAYLAIALAIVGVMMVAVLEVKAAVDPVTDYNVFNVAGGKEAFHCKTNKKCPSLNTCPTTCKTRSITGPGNAACFMNCVTCTISCRHRLANCQGFGAVCYDPRFIGGDGVMFYFHGESNKDFSLVSDKNLQINAHFIGKRPVGRSRDYTWVQGLGMLFGTHQLGISAKKAATWSNQEDHFSITFDGEDVFLPPVKGALWTAPSGNAVIERNTQVNSVHVVIDQLMEVNLEIAPITQEDSRIHNYQIDDTDCFAHLQMQFNFFHLSASVDGILGQTYRPDFKNPVKRGVPMPLMGGEDRFLTSSMFATDSKANLFAPSESISEAEKVISLVSANCNTANGGLTCRR